MQENKNTVEGEILEIKNHNSKYDAQLAVVEKDFATLFEGSDMKKHLATLKKKYGGLKINGLEDVEGYEAVKKAISVVRPLRTGLEKKRKEINKDAKTFIETVNDMGKQIQEKIAVIEDALWAEREKYESLQKEKEEAEIKAKQELLDNRIKELVTNGVVFDGSFYAINQISFGVQLVQEMDEEKYSDLLSKVKAENEKNIEAKRIADEAEAKRLKEIENQRLANEAAAAELKRQQDELERQKREMEDAKAALEKQQKEAQEARDKAEREQREREEAILIANRAKRFEDIGYKFNYSKSRWEMESVSGMLIIEKSEFLSTSHDELYEKSLLEIENIKKAKEQREELDRIERERQEQESKSQEIYKARAEELIELGFFQEKYNWVIADLDTIITDEAVKEYSEGRWYEFTNEVKAKWSMKVEEKRVSLLNDKEAFGEWLGKLKAISLQPPTVTDTEIQSRINNIIKAINQ